MRCYSFCLGQSIKLALLFRQLKLQGYKMEFSGDVIMVNLDDHECAEAYVFSNGSVVSWYVRPKQLQALFSTIDLYVDQKAAVIESDGFSYSYGKKTTIKPHGYFNVDLLVLAQDSYEQRLAVSYALSQSVKLQLYDHILQRLVNEHEYLVKRLSANGKIRLSRRKINQVIGEIFEVRGLVNLKGEYLGVPKYFWHHGSDEADFLVVRDYMDIDDRVAVS